MVGIIGGGQLARMCAGPAAELAITLSVLAESTDAAAAQVIPSAPVGTHRDIEAVRAFARECDVVTFDHEHVPADVLSALEADGVALHPSPAALRFAQDKLAMRHRLTEIDVACPAWARARTAADVDEFAKQVGWPIVAKTPRGGYDGKGVRVVSSADELEDWLEQVARDAVGGGLLADGLLLEEKVDFTRELAVLIARSPSDQAAAWPVVETVQTDGICTQVLAPAPDLDPRPGRAGHRGRAAHRREPRRDRRARGRDVRGARCRDGPPGLRGQRAGDATAQQRPLDHGRGGDGAVRAAPAGRARPAAGDPPAARAAGPSWPTSSAATTRELYPAYRHLMARDPGLKVHLYGKGVRPGRKIGHVNVSGTDLADLRERAGHAADYLAGVITE